MDNEHFAYILNGLLVALALGTLGTMLAKGALRERAIALGPERDIGLERSAYIAGVAMIFAYVGLMIGGMGSDNQLVQSLSAMVTLLVPLLMIGLLMGKAMNSEAGFRKLGIVPRHPIRDVRWGLLAVPIAIALAWSAGLALLVLIAWLDLPAKTVNHEVLERLTNDPSTSVIITAVIGAVVIAPLLEEPVFRGVLQTCLIRLFGGHRWPAMIIASALFSATHASIAPWQDLIPLFVLGLVFGYLYERTGSLLTPILAHAGFNAINITFVLLAPQAV